MQSLTTQKKHAIIIYAGVQKALYLGVAQLVACYLGVVEAAGSSPVTQTRETPRSFEDFSGLRGVFAFREIECSEHYSGTIFSKKENHNKNRQRNHR